MLKLKRYLKPYIALFLGAIILLFGQALLELTLPNYMSDIVNVGLQQGGITQAAPEVIDSDAMAMMQMFMSEEDKALVNAAYEPLSEREDAADLKETYPNAGDEDLALAADPENGVNEAFNRAAYALVSMMEELAPADSATQSEEQASGTLDAEAMVQLTAMLQSGALDEQLNEAIATAAVTPESMLDQTGVVLTKSFYTQLGADTDAIQTSYILKVGLRMAGLAILLTVCAISAGFCMARLGAGVGRDLRRDVFRKVSYFNNNEMDQFSTASLITRSTNDITQVQNFLSMGLRMMCFAPIMGLGGLIMGLSKCVSLAWVLALALLGGIGLWLANFGTGHSNVDLLREVHFDGLELDKSYGALVPGHEQTCRLVVAILHMAHTLDLHVCAKGIENQDQFEFFEELGCFKGQGFLIGKPMDMASMSDYIRKYAVRRRHG